MRDKQAKRRQQRRGVLPGFPKEFKFKDLDDMKGYFSGSKIQCLRCGKMYRKLGLHLKAIHNMEVDEYKEIYGIPWTKGLSCAETSELHAKEARQRIADGAFSVSAEQAAVARSRLGQQRKRQPIRDVLTAMNLEKMNKGKTGEKARLRRLMTKVGTPEHKEKMRNRPQVEKAKEILRTYWVGRDQTDEHVFNRTGSHKKTKMTLTE